MLSDRIRRIVLLVIPFFFALNMTAAPVDLTARYLEKANEAFEGADIDSAYKYVNQALAVSRDEESAANVLYFAQTVYAKKLEGIRDNYNPDAYIDIKMNLDRYPNVANTSVRKLIAQIDERQLQKKEAERQAELETQRRLESERFEKQQESQNRQFEQNQEAIRSQTQAMQDQSAVMKEQMEASAKSQKELSDKLETGIKSLNENLSESTLAAKNSAKVIFIVITIIAAVILVVVLLIVVIAHKGFKQQRQTQEQYVEAFRMLAANQHQTNSLMLGGVTDLYGSSPLKLAGSSRWAPAALPESQPTKEDMDELHALAEKCREIGAKIDQYTGRKNNSKNVGELVYKLAVQLGLPQGEAMLYFCAAMVYDAGFFGIAPELLSADSLSAEQKEQMKEHVNLAEKYLDFVPKKYWSVFEDAARKHHENMDGSGYPEGLKGEAIPQIARLIRVSETYISMSSKRNYRQIIDKETAIEMLKSQPQLYDKDVVEVLEQTI